MVSRGHDLACHGFDHEGWLSKGQSAIAPMSTWEKLRYFFATTGDLRTLSASPASSSARAGLLRARAAMRARQTSVGQPFTYEEVAADIERWLALVGYRHARLFIRYPGYVRSAATLAFLDDRFATTVDSSDLYELAMPLPAFPYRLLAERDGVLRRTGVVEVPCLWIDKLLRTPDLMRSRRSSATSKPSPAFPAAC